MQGCLCLSELNEIPETPVQEDQVLLSVGSLFEDKYKILSVVGRGGMGVVYKAEHEMMGRLVAIKCLRQEMALDSRAFARFQNEARAISTLMHPNIVVVYDFGLAPDNQAYIVMDYLQGITLDHGIEQYGPMDIQ